MNQGKYWMLTCNELSDAYVKVTNEGFGEEINSRVEYAKIALEKGESGNIHFQVYICFLAATRFSSVRKMFPGAHIEQRKGNHLEAKNYIGSSEKSGSVLWVAEVGTDKDIPVLAPAQKRKMVATRKCSWHVCASCHYDVSSFPTYLQQTAPPARVNLWVGGWLPARVGLC